MFERTWRTGLAAACVLGLVTAGLPAAAQEEEEASALSLEASVDWVTAYVWRGMLLVDHPVRQPSANLSYGGLSLNVWGSIDCTDINEDNGEAYRLQEVDYTISYAYSPTEGLDLDTGLIWYTFSGFDSTGEVYVSASFPCVPVVVPSVTAYYDFDEVDGWYVNGALTYGYDITEKLNLELAGGVGWGSSNYHEGYFGEAAANSLSDLLLKATLSYAVTDSVSVSAYAGYTEILKSDVERLAKAGYGDSDVLFGGLSLGVSF